MKALILAAGYGTRLRPLSDKRPKPLVPVVGQPVLWHIITKLKRCKASALGINAHYCADVLEQYVSESVTDMQVHISRETEILGVGGGIAAFRNYLKDEEFFMVHNGDVLSSIDLEQAVAVYREHRPLCMMVLHDHPACNNVVIDSENRVVDIRDTLLPTGVQAHKRAYTGICIMRADILSFLPEKGYADLIPVLIEMIKHSKGSVRAMVVEACDWHDTGTLASYLDAHRKILLERKPLVDLSLIPQDHVFCGSGTSIARDAVITGFVSAGENCRVGSGCRLNNCVLWDNAVVQDGSRYSNAVIGETWVADAGT